MFHIFKKRSATIYKVTYKFVDSEEVFVNTATSAGLASLFTDCAIEILEVVKA